MHCHNYRASNYLLNSSRSKEEGRKKEEGRRKKEEGRRKKEEGASGLISNPLFILLY
ncbi:MULTISPECIES: hypothetical protein [unclassified Microcoleus]|uniref:hypothetical protein n=1 Tax=unclassified Microcoleus TaxID=2642155 RepID=UPI001DC7C0D2|nr:MULTISPECIES: hypothetical protein [unclassified Microcoleus]MCC3444980.1 hypothetical protein [Microcoleus sp. PH2017_03_ELD_O_A]MCC3502187.1 hypothetical protein [Microcoleus sp. PH2017_19_SFW_U_A]MCC3509128.1 hypothetical protein [Microcoleus sp. PH2017_17_BER_D_A]MCC3521330.1 hypothetical protein [Microcoleus sp. PH2017_20_SFW_D_A]MCC3552880.1 hypothetical protein [Microcoleus sp. PH2017_35_SFW_U_B]